LRRFNENELIRLFYGALNEFSGMTLDDLIIRKKHLRVFTGCNVGAMKEHHCNISPQSL